MISHDLFRPSVSLWQHYVTLLSVGGMGVAVLFDSGWAATIVVVMFLVGAAVEGYAEGFAAASEGRERL
ncbi:hypothetical protein PSA3335_18355 [Pseudomonas savastanoi pv. savastanoi NCPPB 3335]|uniref:Uncharacterized protein n=1 Tax=Pseudomonas savastanoi pv. savastanoi NCPPB 3335 TaxID=693985 RepID=A0ABC8BEU7_PSESS|nr:hypothetical protein PSA3335_18355 [Pseudomonas savastanoi pv. savastanoi NCPPB 3335]